MIHMGEIILLSGIFVWLLGAVRFLRRQKKQGGCIGCCNGNCERCGKK